jgi:hypothetical protein
LLARIDILKRKEETLAMTQTKPALSAETGGTEITRFNALRHGVLSRYTVLPWEDADEYRALVAALAAEHAPQGPTEEHLVEELAGILWRKRRLRLAEAAAHRRGLDGTIASYRETLKVALVHLDDADHSESVVDAIRATATDTDEEMADMTADEAMTPCPGPAFGEALDAGKLEQLGRYEVHLDRKLERMLAMLLRLKDVGRCHAREPGAGRGQTGADNRLNSTRPGRGSFWAGWAAKGRRFASGRAIFGLSPGDRDIDCAFGHIG